MHTVHMNRLAKLREEKGLRQEDLAAMIGVDKAKISRAENEHRSAMLATYKACADAMGVPLSAVFSEDLTGEELWLLDVFRSIPEEERPKVRSLLDLAKKAFPEAARQTDDADQKS